MDKFVELGADIAQLWGIYWPRYLNGILNTLILAVVATLAGCLIGFLCGVLNTIPYDSRDRAVKRFFQIGKLRNFRLPVTAINVV